MKGSIMSQEVKETEEKKKSVGQNIDAGLGWVKKQFSGSPREALRKGFQAAADKLEEKPNKCPKCGHEH